MPEPYCPECGRTMSSEPCALTVGERALSDELDRMRVQLEDLGFDRDDWKDRWEILGRVSKAMLDRAELELRLYREHGSPDLTRMVEHEVKLARRRVP